MPTGAWLGKPGATQARSALGPHGSGNRWSAAGASGHDGHGKTAGRAHSPTDDLGHGSRTTAGSNPSASLTLLPRDAADLTGPPSGLSEIAV